MDTAGERLRWARERSPDKLSRRALALELDVAVATYNSHERAGQPGGRGFDEEHARKYARRLGVAWTWLLTGEGFSIPLISWVQAGELRTPDQVLDITDAKLVPMAGLPASGDWFALQVQGDSMDRISPPDSIIAVNRRDRRLVSNACYVIGDGEGGATYKRFRSDPMRFEPVSVNPAHEALFPDQEPTIIGRVKRTILDM